MSHGPAPPRGMWGRGIAHTRGRRYADYTCRSSRSSGAGLPTRPHPPLGISRPAQGPPHLEIRIWRSASGDPPAEPRQSDLLARRRSMRTVLGALTARLPNVGAFPSAPHAIEARTPALNTEGFGRALHTFWEAYVRHDLGESDGTTGRFMRTQRLPSPASPLGRPR